MGSLQQIHPIFLTTFLPLCLALYKASSASLISFVQLLKPTSRGSIEADPRLIVITPTGRVVDLCGIPRS